MSPRPPPHATSSQPCEAAMRNPLLRTMAVLTALVVGCNKREAKTTGHAPPGATEGGPMPFVLPPAVVGSGTIKYYPSIKKAVVDAVMSAETETEAQVVALLGEPSERGQARKFTN